MNSIDDPFVNTVLIITAFPENRVLFMQYFAKRSTAGIFAHIIKKNKNPSNMQISNKCTIDLQNKFVLSF